MVSVLRVLADATLWSVAVQKSSFHILAPEFREVNDVVSIQRTFRTCKYFITDSDSVSSLTTCDEIRLSRNNASATGAV